MDRVQMSSIIEQWNLQPEMQIQPMRRRESNMIYQSLRGGNGVFLSGVRGSGKTTLVRYAIKSLMEGGVSKDNIKYLSVEDPRLRIENRVTVLDQVLEASDLKSRRGSKYLFLDEVNRIHGWEEWVVKNARIPDLVISATRSGRAWDNDRLGDHGTLVNLYPLSLPEVMSLSTGMSVDSEKARWFLEQFLISGGLPNSLGGRNQPEYYGDLIRSIIWNDILEANEIRDVEKLTVMMVDLLSRPGGEVSANKLKNTISGSIDQSRSFLSLLEGTGIITLTQRLEDLGRQAQTSRRVFSADTGLSSGLSPGLPMWALVENAIVIEMLKRRYKVACWKAGGLAGLVTVGEEKPQTVFYVAYGRSTERLMPVIEKLMSVTGCRQAKILVDHPQGSETSCSSGSITLIPAWDFFINPDHYEVSTDIKVDSVDTVELPEVEEAPKKPSMPSHLL